MRKLLPLLACLMLVLTGWSGVAHAAESMMCGELTQAEEATHIAGDGDEVPADADKGYPHHHAACHDHQVAAPVEGRGETAAVDRRTVFASRKAPIWRAHQSDPALRPPQA
jgi:hypothetical protein